MYHKTKRAVRYSIILQERIAESCAILFQRLNDLLKRMIEATVEADVVQNQSQNNYSVKQALLLQNLRILNESDDKAAVLTIRLQECPNSFVQKHRRGLIMNMQKNAITFKSTTHPYETLSEEEKSLAETGHRAHCGKEGGMW